MLTKIKSIPTPPNNRIQPDFGELALPSAADAKRYAEKET